jgi:hypothetical protein
MDIEGKGNGAGTERKGCSFHKKYHPHLTIHIGGVVLTGFSS